MTQRGLDELRREWQKRLRLQDWKIKASIVGSGVIDGDDLGVCKFITEARRANIEILDPEVSKNSDPSLQLEQDIEDTLVHELLHCHFSLLMPNSNKMINLAVEQIIDSLAGAFIELKKQNKPARKSERAKYQSAAKKKR